ncbi:DUF354 domain-containing protein [Methanococcoides sp. NM1]|uniref:DUF354 domain-containing protein n=1 Tax=Methanococcoides sp. NM1 TaxID=1201013 RepID=UPI0010831381|nr:DUF354 domain-containing protein [Methanococcoides sp. NM1]
MKILIDMGHPAHVHFFKNTIRCLEQKGHHILVTARDKEVTLALLKAYGIEHIVLSSMGHSKGDLFKEFIIRDYKLFRIAKNFNPDILMGILNPTVAHVARLLRKSSIIFNDTEHAALAQKITYPFTDVVCTPSCFKRDIGKKQIRYNGYHELAYLHPNYFTPDPDVLNEFGLNKGDPFIILRFVSWGASHDVGHHGIQNKMEFVKKLEKYGRVLITSEGELDDALKKNRIKVSPEKLHDLLYYASLYVGDGGTTAVESAILGIPSIYVSSLAGTMGNFTELEEKYGLLFNYNDSNKALNKAVELIQDPSIKEEWNKKREKLLRDKIDVTKFMVRYIENYSDNMEFRG